MGVFLDLRTFTTAGARGPVGDVDRRPRLVPAGTVAAAFLPRRRLTVGAVVAATTGAELASSPAFNKLSSSDCNCSMRS